MQRRADSDIHHLAQERDRQDPAERASRILPQDWCRYGGGGDGDRAAAGQRGITLMPNSATVPQVEAVVRLGLWYAGFPDALVIERQLPSA